MSSANLATAAKSDVLAPGKTTSKPSASSVSSDSQQDPSAAPQVTAFLSDVLGLTRSLSSATTLQGGSGSVSSASAASTGKSQGGLSQTGLGQTVAGQAVAAGTATSAAASDAVSSSLSKTGAPESDPASMVKSVSVETQFAPGPSLSPMQQVIDTVQKLTAGTGDGAATTSSSSPTVATTVSSASTRTMTLVLEPENLGTVTVKMQMRGDSLDLQLDVANPQTLALLNKDRDSLTAAMSSQDYAMGTLTMRASDVQSSSTGSNDGSQNQNQGSSGQGSYQSASDGGQNGGAYQNGGTFSDGSNGGRGTGGNAGSSASQSSQLDGGSSASSPSSGVYI
ncbi:MAG: flagellar hook-length control protein FliK [Beijerinckiaceae bacterium]|nr:flagellar hook-length control protein FliK [Beijerinckiaceae bacterium]